MVAFSTAFLAACLVLAAAGGIRMIRDDGTGHLASTVSTIRARASMALNQAGPGRCRQIHPYIS